MNKNDINQLLEYSNNQILELDSSIKKNAINKPLLKNILENMRSILDYIAKDLFDITEDKSGKVYFPYGERHNHFKKSLSRNLPKLERNFNSIFQIIEEIQPFKCGNRWLVDLCELTNEPKHNNLSKTEKVKNSVIIGNSWKLTDSPGNLIINSKIDGLDIGDMITDQNTEILVTRKGEIPIDLKTNKEIKFKGREIDIMPFLTFCHSNLKKLTDNIYLELDK